MRNWVNLSFIHAKGDRIGYLDLTEALSDVVNSLVNFRSIFLHLMPAASARWMRERDNPTLIHVFFSTNNFTQGSSGREEEIDG